VSVLYHHYIAHASDLEILVYGKNICDCHLPSHAEYEFSHSRYPNGQYPYDVFEAIHKGNAKKSIPQMSYYILQ
jgi:hypothetical protein